MIAWKAAVPRQALGQLNSLQLQNLLGLRHSEARGHDAIAQEQ